MGFLSMKNIAQRLTPISKIDSEFKAFAETFNWIAVNAKKQGKNDKEIEEFQLLFLKTYIKGLLDSIKDMSKEKKLEILLAVMTEIEEAEK